MGISSKPVDKFKSIMRKMENNLARNEKKKKSQKGNRDGEKTSFSGFL